jgi:hypothetical protein
VHVQSDHRIHALDNTRIDELLRTTGDQLFSRLEKQPHFAPELITELN